MDIGSSVLAFYQNHEVVLSYGAGTYAMVLNYYLKSYERKLSACVVTGKAPEPPVFMESVPIFSISGYPVHSGVRYGIILALDQRFHSEVKDKIKEVFREQADILPLTKKNVRDLQCLGIIKRRDNVLYEKCQFAESEKKVFEKRINEISKQFKSIQLKHLLAFSIGALGLSWMKARIEQAMHSTDTFYLYYPIVWLEAEELESLNDVLLYHQSAPGIEVISKKNIRFWQYFLANHGNMFHITDEFDLDSCYESFCQFTIEHQEEFPGAYISFSTDEQTKAVSYCKETMNLNEPFIAFSVRDSLYLEKVKKVYRKDSSVFADSFRNSRLENFKLAMEHLGQQGVQTVRMGAVVPSAVDWKGTVDYAYNYRSEFMDLWLASQCLFFVSNMSGIQALPQLFQKPLVAIASPCLTQRNDYSLFLNRNRDVAIFRKCWFEKEQRYLTFREMLAYETDLSFHENSAYNANLAYRSLGIITFDNTPEEIDDVVQEMYARIQGTMEYTAEDEELQQRFFDIIDSFPMKKNFPFMFRVGAKFLRQNPWLLD